MRKLVLATAAFVLSSLAAAWADPAGTYTVKGTELDGSTYEGTLEIEKNGDVYALAYSFADGTEQEGSAIGDDNFLAYGYGDDEELGVGLMTGKDGNWQGVWTHLGANKMSTETWTRK